MANINLERDRSSGAGSGWVWALLGLVVLILLAWWLWPDQDAVAVGEPVFEGEQVEEIQPPGETAGATRVSVAEIIDSPDTYTGESLSAEVSVVDVPTDRGFWIEEAGERLFVILNDQPRERPIHIQENMSVRLDGAVVRSPAYLQDIGGEPLDSQTESIVRGQDVFLTVDEDNVMAAN